MSTNYRIPIHKRILNKITQRKWFPSKDGKIDYPNIGTALSSTDGQMILDYLFDFYIMVDITPKLSTDSDLNRDMINRLEGAKRVYFDLINRLPEYERAGSKK